MLWSPQLLTLVLLAPGGQGKVLQAFDYLRTVADEPKRFQMLVLSLTYEPVNPIYQVQKKTSFFQEKVCTNSKFDNTFFSTVQPVSL